MAGDGVRLVERLRLGEKPQACDWNLAAALLALRDASTALVVAATDLVQDREKATKWPRFEVRVRLLALAAARLESESERASKLLAAYFGSRAEDIGDEDDDGASRSGTGNEAPLDSIETELGAALAAGGIESAQAKAIGSVGETVRLDAAWLATGLTDLLAADPDIDLTLDFCGEIEARFDPSGLRVEIGSRLALAEALSDALDRVSAGR